MAYEVYAIRYATRPTTKSEVFFGYGLYGEPDADIVMDYFFWLLRDGARTVVVDTGFDPRVGERRGRSCLCAPLEALARLGVAADSVSQLVLTHLHYDHAGNAAAFPHAELVVQQRELDFWTGRDAGRFHFAAYVEPSEIGYVARSERVRVLDGAATLAPGVEAIRVGGHSPGQQVLVVDGERGPVVLASDALHYYEELERDRPFAIVVDLAEMYRGYDTLRELTSGGAALVAGHDPAVLERFPQVAGGLAARVA